MYRRSRFCHTLCSRPWAARQNLVYGFSVVLARRQAGIVIHPFIPIAGFILKSRNRPFEQIRRNQHHRGKVLFTVPLCSQTRSAGSMEIQGTLFCWMHRFSAGVEPAPNYLAGNCKSLLCVPFSAPGRNRTCMARFKRPVLCLLSYRRMVAPASAALTFPDGQARRPGFC